MSEPPKPGPRGKVPEAPARKPFVAPGLSSFVNPTEQVSITKKAAHGEAQGGQPTNRSKYENKPMPPTPTASALSTPNPRSNPRLPVPTQPATPFVGSSRKRQDAKNRAFTAPIMPQPLFTTQQKSTPQQNTTDNRGESTQASPVDDEASEIQGVHPVADLGMAGPRDEDPSPTADKTSEGSEFQGFRRPVAHNKIRNEVSSSAPPTHVGSSAYGSWTEDLSATRHPRSTPLPHPQEKGLPSPPLAHDSFPSSSEGSLMDRDETQGANRPEGMILGDGVLNPTRTGTYARVGEVGYVEHGPHRVISQVVQMEGIDYSGTSDTRGHPSATSSQGPTFRRSTQYAPSAYTRVWENNPHVGHSLPPYGPDIASYPVVYDRHGKPVNRPTPYQSSPYAPISRGNSYASTNAASNKRFSNASSRYVERNAAPTPPRSYPGFQPSGPMSAELTQMEMNLHHHIDNRADNLTRLMIDKIDRLGDHIAMRFDSLDESAGKAISKGLKSDLRDIKGNMVIRHRQIEGIANEINGITASLRARDLKLDALEKKIEEGACNCLTQDAEANGSEAGRQSPPRRTESAGAYLGRGEQHVQPPASQSSPRGSPGGRQPSTGGHQPSNGGHQQSTGGHRSRVSRRQLSDLVLELPTDANAQRQFFVELGDLAGPPPDISQHPAHRRAQPRTPPQLSQDPMAVAAGFMNNEDIAYQVPNFRRDWYKHAFQKN